MNEINQNAVQEKSAYNIALIVYIMQTLSFFAGVTAIVGIIINYVKLDEVKETWIESHFRWQIRTFWFALLWTVVGGVAIVIGIGFIILAVTFVWYVYRIAKGWMRLSEYKSIS
ncbi:MAG: hypothetical protein AABY34_07265 [Pseudomonadota bacterium]